MLHSAYAEPVSIPLLGSELELLYYARPLLAFGADLRPELGRTGKRDQATYLFNARAHARGCCRPADFLVKASCHVRRCTRGHGEAVPHGRFVVRLAHGLGEGGDIG